MEKKELSEILEKHKLWRKDKNGGERADLCGADLYTANLREAVLSGADLRGSDLRKADLCSADLSEANLRGAVLSGADLCKANLHGADLRGADLHEADLDFSSFPLWCGSFDIKVDDRLPVQLIYHICKMDIQTEDKDLRELIDSELFRKVANKFHRAEECGRV